MKPKIREQEFRPSFPMVGIIPPPDISKIRNCRSTHPTRRAILSVLTRPCQTKSWAAMNSGTSKRRVLSPDAGDSWIQAPRSGQTRKRRHHRHRGWQSGRQVCIQVPCTARTSSLLVAKGFRPRSRSCPLGSRLSVWEASLPHKGAKEPRCGFFHTSIVRRCMSL